MVPNTQQANGGVTQAAPPESAVVFTPRADILETPEEMLVLLDVPGVKADGVDIRFERGELVVHARCPQKPQSDHGWLATEYAVGDYYRAFVVGQEIDVARISAELKNGVLALHLPRADSAKARRISVKGA